ncbi:MAG TPA: hypothetical protein VHE13_02635 [Opitutus sp.]|nr:hypothetical protein [Opitutus sp.]
MKTPASSLSAGPAARRNLVFGWWSLAVFLVLGLGLEGLHGFKLGWYLDVGHEMRRLMLTLAHAHGTLLALVNIAAGLTQRAQPRPVVTGGASWALIAAGVLLPAGFALGGIVLYDGDPGLGILLVPVGALAALIGVVRIAREVGRAD